MHASTKSLTLTWSPPGSNGAAITEYNLEMETEEYGSWSCGHFCAEPFQSLFGQALSASRSCRISFSYCCLPPPPPPPPLHLFASTLIFFFCLAGFQSVYHGLDTQCIVPDLRRVTEYKFRLSASNSQGTSKYSPNAVFATSAAAPSAPAPPAIVARTQTSLTLAWQVQDDGGADVAEYLLEMDGGTDAIKDWVRSLLCLSRLLLILHLLTGASCLIFDEGERQTNQGARLGRRRRRQPV